ncbi:hypothetical protein XENTR_v10011783 [Xenopus tropicalis]|nr:hypothetical protein XENTR_v10011783 [Xenopus tropicalis]
MCVRNKASIVITATAFLFCIPGKKKDTCRLGQDLQCSACGTSQGVTSGVGNLPVSHCICSCNTAKSTGETCV